MITAYNIKNHTWRDQYNPLRGLSLPKLISLMEAGERGAYADLQWFYHYMERSDAMIHAVIQRRRAALLACDWDIRKTSDVRCKTLNVTDAVLADEQAAFLREAYDRVENFRDAVSFMFSGFFRGYAHLEKHIAPLGMVTRLEPVEQWFWVRDGLFGAWEYNQDAKSGVGRGESVDFKNFLIFESVPLNRMLAESGSGTLAGNAHSDTFLQIARGDAALLSGLFQEQFDTPLLREYFPDQPILAYFEFAPPAADEVSRVVKDAVELAKAGARMDLRELEEKTGYKLERSSSVRSNNDGAETAVLRAT
jgi:hypothetical protein